MAVNKIPLFDVEQILKNTPDRNLIPITLKKTENKGTGVFATKNIPAKTVVALYRLKIFNKNEYDSPTNYKYSFEAYTKSGNSSRSFIADLDVDEGLLPPYKVPPMRYNGLLTMRKGANIPYWAYFANEPTRGVQEENVEFDTNLKENYATRSKLKAGDHIVYKMVTSRDIKKGEELVWYYGDVYERDY